MPPDVQALWAPFVSELSGEISVPHAQENLQTLGPITRKSFFVQEIEVSFESIDCVELLLATYDRNNTSINIVGLVSDRGELLYSEQFPSGSVVDNAFYRLKIVKPIDLRSSAKISLMLGSLDGSKGNSITAWTNTNIGGALASIPGTGEDVLAAIELAQRGSGTPIRGSLVYKIRGKRAAIPVDYRQPFCPADFESRGGHNTARAVVHRPHGKGGEAAARIPRWLETLAQEGRAHIVAKADDALSRLEAQRGDLLILAGVGLNDAARKLIRSANVSYLPSLYYVDDAALAGTASAPHTQAGGTSSAACEDGATFAHAQMLRCCTFALCTSEAGRDFAKRHGKQAFVIAQHVTNAHEAWSSLCAEVWSDYRRLHRPRVSIVTILYRKEKELGPVLDSYFNQTYDGDVEVICVDDSSPDNSVQVVEEYIAAHAPGNGSRRIPQIRIIRNDRNLGNCISRNVGIENATGDLILVVDADCMLNRDFIKRHVEAHAFDDCEVVIGPVNIETHGREPSLVLEQYEGRSDLVMQHCDLQDRLNKNSFLNCITRNFSIKARALSGELFDPLLTYSADPQSGFGWEDVEMGYRLYRRGLRIKYVDEAFAIHVSPEGVVDDASKPLRSMKNFRRMLEKHPELAHVARRWVTETTDKILGWADACGAARGDDRRYLESITQQWRRIPKLPGGRKLRILTYRWHVPHQYELYKLPFDFTLVTGLGSPMTDSWQLSHRPMPPNARFRHVEEIDPGNYDLAILHFDENVLAPENTNGHIGDDWGRAFKWFREHVDLPKIAVCHGTPQFRGQYDINYSEPDLMQVIESERIRLVEYLGDIPVVVNSHQAHREWEFKRSRVIWHGFDPTEFPPATHERGILSPLGPLVTSRPHYRGYFLYRKVFEGFPPEHAPETLRVPEPHVLYTGNAYAMAKYRNYVDEIRSYSVYFNPTLRSPMPRARAEPMMCGVVTVNANNHDVDMFIKNGVNGFYSNEPAELREMLLYLVRDREAARRMGAASRQTALELFNHDRYLTDWMELLGDVLGKTAKESRSTGRVRASASL